MEATDLSCDVSKNISSDEFKIDIKNESFEDWKDSSSNKQQGFRSKLSLEVEKEQMSSNPRDPDLKDGKLPIACLAINTRPSSNSDLAHERNDFLQIRETLNPQEDEAEHTSFSIQEIKPSSENESNDDLNYINSMGIVIGHITEKFNRNSKQMTDNKASGKFRKTSDKEKSDIKKSRSPHSISKTRNEEIHGSKHKLASAIAEKNQGECNLPGSCHAQKLTSNPWQEASCSRENHARKLHMSSDRNITIRTDSSNNKSTDKKSKYPSKKDYCEVYSSDQNQSDKKNYSYYKTFNNFLRKEIREDKQYIPHSKKISNINKISNVEENEGEMKEAFSYNSKNCSENPPVLDDKNLSQKQNVGYNDKLKDASCADNEVMMSFDIYKVNSKTAYDGKREVSTYSKGNEGEMYGPPSPLTKNTKVTNDCGKRDEVLCVNNQQVLPMPLNKNNFEHTQIEETTRVERTQPEVATLSDTRRKNVNEFPSEEVHETLNTKEARSGNEESADSSEPRFNLRNERAKSVEVINVEEDQLDECYSCPRCTFTATNKITLSMHLYTHSNANLLRNTHDDMMHRILRNPIRRSTRKQSSKKPSKKSSGLKCYFCGYKCMRKNKLEKHIYENHFSKKVYKCYACSYESSDMDLFKRHSEAHFKNDTFQCASCHRCPCDNLRQLREMCPQKRFFSDIDEDHNRYKRGKFDCRLQDAKYESIMMMMNKINDNLTLLTQTSIAQGNELCALVSCLKTNKNTAFASSDSKDSPTIQPSISIRQQIPNSRYICPNCQPQASTSGCQAKESLQNLNGGREDKFSLDNSSID